MQKFNSERRFRHFVKPMVSLYKYCLVLVFSISFLCENAFAFTASAQDFANHDSDGAGAIVYDAHKTTGIPIGFPLFAEPGGLEDSETEPDNDNGGEIDFCFTGYGHASVFETGLKKSPSVNFVSLIMNRETISLIVLHHSWKNDLA